MIKKREIAFAVASGILVALSLPGYLFGWKLPDLSFLAWLALVPLIIVIRESTPARAYLLTMITAVVWYGLTVFWVYNAMEVYGNLGSIASVLITILFVSVVALFVALAPMAARFVIKNWHGDMIIFLPISWVAVELFRNYFPFGGFPWANLSMSQAHNSYIAQISDLTGAYGITFLIVSVNCLIADIILWYLIRRDGRKLIVKAVFVTSLIISALIYGVVRIGDVKDEIASAPAIKVGLLQGNVLQTEKWDKKFAIRNLNIYREGSKRLAASDIDIIFWPESAFPWTLDSTVTGFDKRMLGDLKVRGDGRPFIVLGAITEGEDGNSRNSAFLFDGGGLSLDRYDKVHLAPFGEYVPLAKMLFFVKKLTEPVGRFVPGERIHTLVAGNAEIGPLICYEDSFPEIARAHVSLGAQFLATLTNDAWFGMTSMPYQHLALSTLRAIEVRRFVVRSANTGVSAVINAAGEVEVESKIFEPASIAASIKGLSSISIYARLGDWFASACMGYLVIGLIISAVRILRARKIS